MKQPQISGPKAGVDYGVISAELPKLTANLDYIDHALFEMSPMVFLTLVDQKPDSKNRLSHLIITREQRQNLIQDIDRTFGDKLKQKDQNYTVSAAWVLKAGLQKDYKCSDDPW